jgi:tRNA(Ile)-lysidine synthase
VTDPLDRLRDAVARGADGEAQIPNDAALVLAVSGGPDSISLLHGAARLGPERGWQLTVAHLDHGLRERSALDARFVEEAAETVGLPCVIRQTDVAALAAAERRSLEDAGREARYRFLAEVAGEEGLIATGHTADDSAETILLNLSRGSGLSGVSGIPARRGRVARPLLGERRSSLREALEAAGIAYLVDETNLDVAHARNRIRLEVLPALEHINPATVETLNRFGRLAADDDALLDHLAAAELDRRTLADAEIDWRKPPERALGRRVLRLACGEPPPAFERIEALLDAAEGPRGGVTIEIGGGREASVKERRIRISQ